MDAYSTEDGSMDIEEAAVKRAEATAEPVRLFTGYGVLDGVYRELEWEGRASRSKKVAVGPLSLEQANPDWF